ncbi:MAG TPA: hypothetical protein VGB30_10905 [bacterium]|jgi:hypothetical protein
MKKVLPITLSTALAVSIVICSSLIIGCSGGGGVDPISPDDAMSSSSDNSLTRTAQAFSTFYEWGDSYNIDSATTIWVPPIDAGASGIAGQVAVYDYEVDASPLITAIVKSDPGGSGSEISLAIFQSAVDASPEFEDTFSADNDAETTWCRHPTVEVAYCNEDDANAEGYIFVYIVWAQLNETDSVENVDLYSKRYIIDFNGSINWSTDVTESGEILLTDTQSSNELDEVEPDLALKLDGDLLLAYVRTEYANFDEADILAIEADYDDTDPTAVLSIGTEYAVSYNVSGLPNTRNFAPSIEVGMVDSFADGEDDTAYCVWTQQIYWDSNPSFMPAPYVVFYNVWDSEGSATPGNQTPITSGGNNADALPKVDLIPVPASISLGEDAYQEAVISWTHFDYSVDGTPGDWGDQHYEDPEIHVTVSPDFSSDLYAITSEYGIAPDVACYERSSGQEAWFGLAYYYGDTGGDLGEWEWDGVYTRSFSYDTSHNITWEDDYSSNDFAPTFWSLLSPFTGPTLCLRDPSPSDSGGTPDDDIFFLGGIEDDSPNPVWVSSGTIKDI